MTGRVRAFGLLVFLIPFLIACQAGQQSAGSDAESPTALPTSTETPSPTPTSSPTPTPTPEPVFSYFTNGDEINAMTVDDQGVLWAATSGGVVRWDLESGAHTLFTRADGLPTNIIKTITAAADGSIWAIASSVSYSSGTVIRYLNGEWTAHPSACGSAESRANAFTATADGVWVGCTDGVSFFDGQAWANYTETDGLLGTYANEIYVDPEGRVWVGSDSGINWFEDGVWNSKLIGADAKGFDANMKRKRREDLAASVRSITRAPNGSMWFGTGMGGARYANGTWSYFTELDGLLGVLADIEFDRAGTAWSYDGGLLYYYKYNHWFWLDLDDLSYINVLERDQSGGLWVGTRETGALYLQYPNFTLLDIQSGALASDEVKVILPLEDGSTLFGHGEAGISRVNLQEETQQTYQLNTGVPAASITTIAPNPDGTMWIHASTSVYFFDGQQWENYSERNIPALGRTLKRIHCIQASPDGTLWVGSYTSSSRGYENTNLIASWDGRQWTGYAVEDGFEGRVVTLANGLDGSIWALLLSKQNIIHLASFQNGAWTSVSFGEDFPSKQLRSLAVDHAGTVWIATGDMGLLRLDQSEWNALATEKDTEPQAASTATGETGADIVGTTPTATPDIEWHFLTTEDGLPGDTIYDLFVDTDGNLWVGTDQGLVMYDHSSWKTHTVEDGLAGNIVTNISQAQDGAIWVGTSAGASRFDGISWQTLTAVDGLGTTGINEIAGTADGALWFATYENGLTRYGPPEQP